MTESEKHHFETDGYHVIEGFLQGKLLDEIRRESEELAAADYVTGDLRVWHERALFRRKAFRELISLSLFFDFPAELVGGDVQLLAFDLLFHKPGKGGIHWHRDVTFLCNKTVSMNMGIYLYDTGECPLRLIPGSHRNVDVPENLNAPHPDEVVMPVRAGTAVFFDAGLLHSGSVNESEKNRLGVFAFFGHYWVKRMDNYFTQPLPASLLQTKNPKIRQLLGLELQEGITSYHGDNEGYNRVRGEPGIDFVEES